MNRDELKGVYEDTINRIEIGEYEKELVSKFYTLKKDSRYYRTKLSIRPFETNVVDVKNDDCINVAGNLSKTGKTCMLNMASYKRPGGGVRNGAMAQEEELCRRSNLVYGLDERNYPLNIDEFIYTKDVTFFKDRNYNIMPEFKCDIITMAAVNLNVQSIGDYESIMRYKIANHMVKPYEMGCENLVLSAFGCGVFGNDPHFVASLFKDINLFNLYKNVSFAILNDRNSVGSNFQVFKEVLDFS